MPHPLHPLSPFKNSVNSLNLNDFPFYGSRSLYPPPPPPDIWPWKTMKKKKKRSTISNVARETAIFYGRDSFDSISMQRRERGEESKFSRSIKFRNGWYPLKKKKMEGEIYDTALALIGMVSSVRYFRKYGFELDFWRSGRSENSNERTNEPAPGTLAIYFQNSFSS